MEHSSTEAQQQTDEQQLAGNDAGALNNASPPLPPRTPSPLTEETQVGLQYARGQVSFDALLQMTDKSFNPQIQDEDLIEKLATLKKTLVIIITAGLEGCIENLDESENAATLKLMTQGIEGAYDAWFQTNKFPKGEELAQQNQGLNEFHLNFCRELDVLKACMEQANQVISNVTVDDLRSELAGIKGILQMIVVEKELVGKDVPNKVDMTKLNSLIATIDLKNEDGAYLQSIFLQIESEFKEWRQEAIKLNDQTLALHCTTFSMLRNSLQASIDVSKELLPIVFPVPSANTSVFAAELQRNRLKKRAESPLSSPSKGEPPQASSGTQNLGADDRSAIAQKAAALSAKREEARKKQEQEQLEKDKQKSKELQKVSSGVNPSPVKDKRAPQLAQQGQAKNPKAAKSAPLTPPKSPATNNAEKAAAQPKAATPGSEKQVQVAQGSGQAAVEPIVVSPRAPNTEPLQGRVLTGSQQLREQEPAPPKPPKVAVKTSSFAKLTASLKQREAELAPLAAKANDDGVEELGFVIGEEAREGGRRVLPSPPPAAAKTAAAEPVPAPAPNAAPKKVATAGKKGGGSGSVITKPQTKMFKKPGTDQQDQVAAPPKPTVTPDNSVKKETDQSSVVGFGNGGGQ